jgi:hypothetical protein
LTCKQFLDVPGEVVDDGICTLNIQPTSGIVLFLFSWGVIDFICFNSKNNATYHHPSSCLGPLAAGRQGSIERFIKVLLVVEPWIFLAYHCCVWGSLNERHRDT